MSLRITLPTLLQKITDGLDIVELDANNVSEIIDKLDERYPGFRARICDDSGTPRRFINIYVEGEDIRFLDNLSTRVPDGCEVAIIPAIAGG